MLSKQSIILLSACVALYFTASLTRAEPYELSDGIETEYIGSIKQNFICTNGGYYADVDNNCQLFHVCLEQEIEGKREMAQYTFACGNQTIFNQFSMTCAHPEEAVPCASAPDFFYLNDRIGQNVNIHEDADLDKASALYPGRRQ